jgi:hypothetical protein
MNDRTIWDIMTGTQVTTSLMLIAISLVVIAVKLTERKSPKTKN